MSAAKINGGRKAGVMGAILVVLLTLVLFPAPPGQWLVQLSYDWLFRLRSNVEVRQEPVVIAAMDQESEGILGQSSKETWNRALHAELLVQLKRHGAQVVAFDVFFSGATTNDDRLLAGAKAHGKVFFGASLGEQRAPSGEVVARFVGKPFGGVLEEGDIGLVETSQTDAIFRRHQLPQAGTPSLAWRVAEVTVADLPGPGDERWINYYGPPGQIQRVSYASLLSNTIPHNVSLTNAIVFVGAVARIGPTAGSGADYFDTPYGRLMPGVEVIASVYLNLLRGDWLRRTDRWLEFLILLAGGIGWGYGLARVRPLAAVVITLGSAGVITVLALVAQSQWFIWFPWMLICGLQLPVALGWSVLVHTRRLETERHRLEEEKVVLERELATAVVQQGERPPSPMVPDMTLLRCVGKGAYGEVWLGRDVVGNLRAVKVIYRATFSSDVPFEREFKGIERFSPLSRSHPGWVDVLHIGRNEQQNYFFYIMEPADDIRLGQAIDAGRYEPKTLQAELERRGRFELREALDLSLALASALEHLHRHGLVHRDIKPANVIFVNGKPKFTDIGLITETAGTRDDVSWIGTEGYMPPEGPGAPTADVYGLGKLIYEVAMGRDRRAFPELPTAMLDSEPGDGWDELNAIIMRACEVDVGRRFQSASVLHAELLRLLGGLGREAGER